MENFLVIWLDLNVNQLNDSVCQLRQCLLCPVQTFDDVDQCVDLLSEVQDEKIFFIVSDSEQNWTKNWDKIHGISTDIETIIDLLRQNFWQREQSSCSISIIPISIDLNELDPSFMYSQLLKEMLLEINYDQQAKIAFIQYCHDQYVDNNATLDAVNNFERDYHLHSPIW